MSTDDACILTPILLATIAALFVIHRTFRVTTTARDALITPPIFAVIGGLVGISVGMIFLSSANGRVTIEKGVAVLLNGIVLGSVVGLGARVLYSRLGRGKGVVFVLVATLLGVSIGAPIGWITGDFGSRPVHDEYEQLRVSRMLWGILIGSGVGFLLGLPELLSRPSVVT